MDLEARTTEIRKRLHKANSKIMSPITVSAIVAISVYVIGVFHWLIPPDAPAGSGALASVFGFFHFAAFGKVFFLFLLDVVICTIFFERWVARELQKACLVLAWDPARDDVSERQVINSLVALLDFPHRFVIRFLVQWIITVPVAILGVRLFYEVPIRGLVYLALGVIAMMCLMSVFHYFVIRNTYIGELKRGLEKFPAYFKHAELSNMRISHRHKVMIYLMVLVASITWVTTHLSIIGQEFSENYQRGKFLEHRLDDVGDNLVSGLENNLDARFLSRGAQSLKGSKSEKAFIIDQNGNNLTAEEMSDVDREIMDLIPAVPKIGGGGDEKVGALDYLKDQFIGLSEPLAVKINDRIMLVYAEGKQYSVSLDVLRPEEEGSEVEWYFVTIKPNSKDAIQYLFQDAPILGMFVVALVLSVIFARFMQHEVMSTLSRIIDSSKKIEEGDLSEPPPIMADDEFGELAVHHLRMVSSVRSMIRQLGAGASQTDDTAARIREQTEEMARGSQAQSIAVEETSATIAEMNQTIGAIAESVDTLASSAEESSAAIIEMSATNDEVATSSEQLSEAVEESTASIQEMSASIREVAENVRNAAGKTGEVAHSMRNLREAVKEVDQIAAQTSEVSIQVTRDAETGMSSVNSTITGINQIWEEARSASEVIERLSKRAREIGRILTVIEDVTEETNLLALNAAIIAAQAGEHGRGFAVVADEIKDLAERTQASTAEIAEQIQAVQTDAANAVRMVSSTEESVSKGVLLSEEAGEALQKILDSSKLSMEMAKNISDSTQKQSKQAEQILNFFETVASMIDQINNATQEQSRGSDQIIKASEKMRDIAGQVRKATREQALGSRQISQAIEHITHISSYINSSQSEQKKAAQQVLAAITRIADIANANVSGVEQTMESVNSLKVLAEEFKRMIDEFQAGAGAEELGGEKSDDTK